MIHIASQHARGEHAQPFGDLTQTVALVVQLLNLADHALLLRIGDEAAVGTGLEAVGDTARSGIQALSRHARPPRSAG